MILTLIAPVVTERIIFYFFMFPKFFEIFSNPFWRQQPLSLLSVAADVL